VTGAVAPLATRARRRLVLALALLLGTVACTIEPDAAPRDVPADERSLSPVGNVGAAATTGASRMYLVAPGTDGQQRRLRSVQRDVTNRPDPLLQVLFDGPNQSELDERLRTSIPAESRLLSTRLVGDVLFVDISDEITELSGEALVLAVAQIVFTAAEADGVQAVRLRVDGEDQAWPTGAGQTREGPLRVYDYPGLAESAQPAFPAVPLDG
jgi:spore germination protein GerM